MSRIEISVPIASGPSNIAALDRAAADLRSHGFSVSVHRSISKTNVTVAAEPTKSAMDVIIFVATFGATKSLDMAVDYVRARIQKHRVTGAQIEVSEDGSE